CQRSTHTEMRVPGWTKGKVWPFQGMTNVEAGSAICLLTHGQQVCGFQKQDDFLPCANHLPIDRDLSFRPSSDVRRRGDHTKQTLNERIDESRLCLQSSAYLHEAVGIAEQQPYAFANHFPRRDATGREQHHDRHHQFLLTAEASQWIITLLGGDECADQIVRRMDPFFSNKLMHIVLQGEDALCLSVPLEVA